MRNDLQGFFRPQLTIGLKKKRVPSDPYTPIPETGRMARGATRRGHDMRWRFTPESNEIAAGHISARSAIVDQLVIAPGTLAALGIRPARAQAGHCPNSKASILISVHKSHI